jgi:membrane associated rhomboid family serine protease
MTSYFFFEVFLAAFLVAFFAAFFAAMVSILPFRCLHRSLQHKMLQLTNV